MPAILQGPALLDRFQALDGFLLEHQDLWRPRPFQHLHLPWETSYPELAQWLRQRTLEAVSYTHLRAHET